MMQDHEPDVYSVNMIRLKQMLECCMKEMEKMELIEPIIFQHLIDATALTKKFSKRAETRSIN